MKFLEFSALLILPSWKSYISTNVQPILKCEHSADSPKYALSNGIHYVRFASAIKELYSKNLTFAVFETPDFLSNLPCHIFCANFVKSKVSGFDRAFFAL